MRKFPKIPKGPSSALIKRTKIKWGTSVKKKAPVKESFAPPPKVKSTAVRKDRPTHIDHIEDRFIRLGDTELFYTLRTLTEVHNMLVASMEDKSYKSSLILTEKFDGSPSIVFGHDKETGRFFVATKSYFSKTPKLNFTLEDIRQNYGYSQNLVDKLIAALTHLPKITPETGIFQGDLMYVQGMNLDIGTDKTFFTANTVTYSCYSDAPIGRKIYGSRMGIAVHTQHTGGLFTPADLSRFKHDTDVVIIDPRINLNKVYYPAEYQREFSTLLQEINNTPLTQTEYAEVMRQSVKLMQYINKQVKGTAEPREETEFASPIFDSFFFVHSHLQSAKKLLNNALSSTRQFHTEINGQETKGEGFVVIYEQRVTKIVDREEFSRQNFLRQTGLKEGAKTTVYAYARMNPPTLGHQRLVEKVKSLAKEHSAEHLIVLSASHGVDNPLPAERKLAYVRELFLNTNFVIGSKGSLDFVARLCTLYNKGETEHLIFVAGDDRIETYQAYLDAYNGKDDYFHFKKITLVSAGARNFESSSVDGVSGTKLRQYAADNQFDDFFRDLPTTATLELAQRLFDDVRKGLIV